MLCFQSAFRPDVEMERWRGVTLLFRLICRTLLLNLSYDNSNTQTDILSP